MQHSYFHKLSTLLWGVLVALIVVLAVYVSFGRLLMSNVERFHTQILQHLNSRIPFHIEARHVGGQLRSFSPEIVLSGLRITLPESAEPPIELAEGRISFHPLESIGAWFPQITKLRLEGLSLRAERTAEGSWSISGLGGDDNATTGWLEQLLLNIESVDLTNNRLVLDVPDQEPLQLTVDLALRREGSERRMEARLKSLDHGATLTAISSGVGNPMRRDSFAGQLYFDIKAQDIAPFQSLLTAAPPITVSGGVDTQIWLAWDNGEFAFEFSLAGEQLDIAETDQSWQFPMERLTMQARVLSDKEHWTVDASALSIKKHGTTLNIPRLNMVSRGDSIHLLAADVPLASVNAMLVDMALTPEAIADVFAVLNTRGQLSSLQIDLADIHNPADDWQLAANFEDFEVDSWRGAPGLTRGSGHVFLNPGFGRVIIDSQAFAMSYPTVYRDPLAYDDFYGTVDIRWDESDVTLASGLMTATAQEGVARVLFGLNVPLAESPVGLEMDLLVGLQDFDPAYRTKYLPYTLSEGLLGWLEPSIEKGRIEQGAFLWRGSLTPDQPDQKTVQLFFNVADTTLDYHPDWPPVTALDGTVLIDDAQVSVWSENAMLYDSNIRQLSAETWLNESDQMLLAIDGVLAGDAADGLQVINQSPLTELVGATFMDWRLAGELDTHLQLTLNIGDTESDPQIAVDTLWREVDVFIEPGGLSLEAVSGQLTYSSSQGFSSHNMAGKLWGKPLAASVRQGAAQVGLAADGASETAPVSPPSEIIVDLTTRVAMAAVQDWLQLDALALAQGESDAVIEIKVAPGAAALLSVESDLIGSTLDLPHPWGKAADQSMPLHIETNLGQQGLATRLTLADSLYLDMQLLEGALDAMNLNFYQPPKGLESGKVIIGGHVPLLEVDQWQLFVSRYIESDVLASFGRQQGLSVQVDKLQADTLVLAGQDLRDVMVDLSSAGSGWLLSAETDWLAGQWSFAHPTETPRLDIRYLDLAQLSELNFDNFDALASQPETAVSAPGDEPTGTGPELMVALHGIHRGPDLLGDIDFHLARAAGTITAGGIHGALAGFRLSAEQPGSLQWDTQENVTRLDATFAFADMGQSLERLGYLQTLETEDGQLALALEWPGGPQSFSLASAAGSLAATVGEGRFLNAPAGASGALRVVSILNLADIIGRVSLSHMFESGVSFHGITAQLFLQDGKIEVASMDVEGNSSGFQFSGVADVALETLEGNLVVILPVANNLPWVVALTAGLPVAAGVLVVSQVFKEQFNRFSSGVYRISGPWADPKVEFVKIFDDSARKKAAKAVAADPNRPAIPADANTPEALEDT